MFYVSHYLTGTLAYKERFFYPTSRSQKKRQTADVVCPRGIFLLVGC
jgi:hypothetical protein